MKTYLVQGDSKFWSISKTQAGDLHNLLIRYGNISNFEETNIKQVLKTFPNEPECDGYRDEATKLKIDKGYKEQDETELQQKKKQHEQTGSKKEKKENKALQKMDLKPDSIAQLTDDALKKNKSIIKGAPVSLGTGRIPLGKVLLAQTWNEEIDPKGYMLSEKLDGMRMVWTGSKMYTRNGNEIHFPPFFVAGWPKSYLDGELWIERDEFQKLMSIARKQVPNEGDWRKVKYMVFDAPGLNLGFKDRYQRFKAAIEQCDNEHIVYVPHIECTGYDHLIDELQYVQSKGGEGLMLRAPDSEYEQRRSDKLLKVKTFEDDEATVIGYEDGTRRDQGLIGALKVRNTLGIEFGVGSGLNDDLRRRPPKIGSVITYKYYGTSKKGVPRFPIYLREKENE